MVERKEKKLKGGVKQTKVVGVVQRVNERTKGKVAKKKKKK